MRIRFALIFFSCLAFFCAGSLKAHAAALYFSPASKQVDAGNILSVDVLVDTQGQAINNAQATVNFPPDLLQVVAVSPASSIFSLWVQNPSFSNGAGTITFNGGVPTPGYNGGNGEIFNIIFRAQSQGTANLYFSAGSVLANDGLGTDVLQTEGQAQFTLTGAATSQPAAAAPAAASSPGGSPAAAQIFSVTNPDSNSWYNNSSPSFNWDLEPGVTAVRILYDKNPGSQPSVIYAPPISEKTLSGLADGVYYFHLQERNSSGWGAVSHFKFQIDTQNPDQFIITQIPQTDSTSPISQFSFNASDSLSGIDHYTVQIDSGQEQVASLSPDGIYTAPALPGGQHTLVVKALDKAGNFLSQTVNFTIQAQPLPKLPLQEINQSGVSAIAAGRVITLLEIWAPIAFLVFIFLVILLFSWHKFRLLKKKVRRDAGETESAMRQVFQTLRGNLEKQVHLLEKTGGKRQLTSEETKIVQQMKKDLNGMEEFLEDEIKRIEKDVK